MRVGLSGYTRQVVIAVAVATVAVLLTLVLWWVMRVLLIVFGGVLLSVLLRALGELFSRVTRVPERWSVLIVGLLLAAVLGAGGWFLSAEIAGEFDELGRSLNAVWAKIQEQLGKYTWGRDLLGAVHGQHLSSDSVGAIGKMIAAAVGGVSGLVVSVIIGLYMTADPALYRRGVLRLTPLPYRGRMGEIIDEVHEALRQWLLGTLVLMTTVGVVITIGLYLLGIPLALALGIIMFFLEFVPYLGPILAAAPAVLIASTISPQDMLFVVLLYWAVQSLEGYVLTPLVFQNRLDLPPMVTIAAQLVLGSLLGILGIVFATPLVACGMVLVRRVYIEDLLGDRMASLERS